MISLATCYYDSYNALMWQKSNLQNSGLDIVIVDDCSPEPISVNWANVYRLKKDIFFNLDAVNLSVLKSKGDTIFRFDLDHRTDYTELSKIVLPEKTIYHFNRFCGDNQIKPNPSHILIHKKDFIEIGGWNTAYSGYYGKCDTDFIRRAKRLGYSFKIAPIKLEVNTNLFTKNISRDTTRNAMLYSTDPICNTDWAIEYEVVNEIQ